MPARRNQDYKNAVFEQLAQGSKDSGNDDHFEHFDNLSTGPARSDAETGAGDGFHPEQLSPEVTRPQFLAAAQKMQPQERAEIMKDMMDNLEQRGLAPKWLQQLLGLGSTDARHASPDDVANLSEYTRQNHPEVFQRVVANKPFFVRWLDKPLVAALVGVLAGKLLNRAYDR